MNIVPEHEEEPRGAASATTGSSVLRGGLWYVATYGVPQAYTFVVSILAARFLGAAGTGRQSFISFVALGLATMLSSSVYVALMRYIGETAGRGRYDLLRGLIAWAWRIEALASVVGGGILFALAAAGASPQGAWALAAVVCVTGILHSVPTAVLVGLQRFRTAAVVGLTTGLVSTVAIGLVLWAGGGITGMFAVEAVVRLLNLGWTTLLARQSLASVGVAGTTRDAQLISGAQRFALISSIGVGLSLVVATRSEFFFLNHFSSDAEIAFYSIAFAAATSVALVPRALAGSITPAFATLHGAGSLERIRSGYSRSLRFLVLSAVPLAAAAAAFGPELIRLAYGTAFDPVVPPLLIMLAALPLTALASLGNAFLSGVGSVWRPLAANAVAAAVDIALAAALVPFLDAKGAAIANVGGQAIYAVIVLFFAGRRLGEIDWRPFALLRVIVTSASAALAGWGVVHTLGGVAGLVIGLVVGAAVFALVAAVVKFLPQDDGAWLEEAAGGRLGGLVGRLAHAWST